VGHGFPGSGVVKVQNIADHILFRLFYDALLFPFAHHLKDFLLCDGIVQTVGIDARQPQQSAHNQAAQGEKGLGKKGKAGNHSGELPGEPLRIMPGPFFGQQVAQDKEQERIKQGHQQEREQRTQPFGPAGGKPAG